MFDFPRPPTPSKLPIGQAEWLDSLRDACITLVRSSEKLITSVVILARVIPGPGAGCSLPELARRVAEEYRLTAEVQQDSDYLIVHLRRCNR